MTLKSKKILHSIHNSIAMTATARLEKQLLLLILLTRITVLVALQSTARPRSWVVPKGVKFGDLSRLKLLNDVFVLLPKDKSHSLGTTNSKNDNTEALSHNTIQIATRAIGLNFADVFTVLGYYTAANLVRGNDATFCPGLEFSGIVVSNEDENNRDSTNDDSSSSSSSSDVKNSEFKPGDRVFGFTRFGAYSDLVSAPAVNLRKLPESWSFEQGASFLVNALTAWHGLVTVAGMPKVSSRNSNTSTIVLVHSAAGGVGLLASEIAARRGGIVIGVVGSADKVEAFNDRIQPLCPAARCFVRSSKTFERDLQEAVVGTRIMANKLAGGIIEDQKGALQPPQYKTSKDLIEQGWGVDYVMESYGGTFFAPSLNLINAGGSLATYGSSSYNGNGLGGSIPFLPLVYQYLTRPRVDPGELTSRNVRVGGFNLIFLTERTDQLAAALEGCIQCLSGGDSGDDLACVKPPIVGSVFSFDDRKDGGATVALSALRSGKTVGKVVLSNPNNPTLPRSSE